MREPDEQALSTTFYKLYGGKNLLNTNCNQLKVVSYHTYHVCSWKWKMLGSIFVNATLISRNIIDSNWMTTQVPQTLGFKVTPCKWLKIYKNLLFHNNLAKRAENIWEIKISDFDAKGCKKFSILRKYWCSCSYQICTQSLPSYGVVVLCERNSWCYHLSIQTELVDNELNILSGFSSSWCDIFSLYRMDSK